MYRLWGALGALLLLGWAAAEETKHQGVTVAFLTDCKMYSDWQSVAMAFSFKMSGQPGDVIRVMCCGEEEYKKYNKGLLNMVTTWVAPDASRSKRNGDHYAAYNKPEAVLDWLDHKVPENEYVLVLDSDMILRRPFFIEVMKPKKGLAVGARYTYMIGVANELAVRHIPHVAPRNDTLAGPFGRRADQVGGFFFIHRDDLKAMSHDWLKFSEDVRVDDQAYRLSGDVYAIHPGDRPWISEMYGYAFGAANHDVWHKWDTFSMIYPGYEPHEGIPKLMHYGLLFELPGKKFSFDKHWHYDFDVTKCPPWDFSQVGHRTHGIFEHPPWAHELPKFEENSENGFMGYYRDVLAIETAETMNAAFCDYHLRHCPPSQQLYDVCKETFKRYNEARQYTKEAEMKYDCQNFHPKCADWAKDGECDKNHDYMTENCRKACNRCGSTEKYFPVTTTDEQEMMLEEILKKLKPDQAQAGDPELHKATVPKSIKSPDIIPKHTEEPVEGKVIPRNISPEEPKKDLSPPAGATAKVEEKKAEAQTETKADTKTETKAAETTTKAAEEEEKKDEEAKETKAEGVKGHATTEEGINDEAVNALMARCYKLELPLEETKACVEAAKEGTEYTSALTKAKAEEEAKKATEKAAMDAQRAAKEKEEAEAKKDQAKHRLIKDKATKPKSTKGKAHKAKAIKLAADAEGEGEGGADAASDAAADTDGDPTAEVVTGEDGVKVIRSKKTESEAVLSHDIEDLSLTHKADKHAAPVTEGGSWSSGLISRMSNWQTLVIWLFVVLAFLAILPRIAKMRRRQRSGMRTE